MSTLSYDRAADVGEIVIEAAYDIFVACKAESDFCVQHVSEVTVFGGVNRLLYSPKLGFYPDRSYCTKRFLSLWDEMKTHD